MRNVTVAAIQMSIPETPEKSVEKAEKLVRKAAAEGANVILRGRRSFCCPNCLKTGISARSAAMTAIN